MRLSILLLLFDVYLTWARIEKASSSSSADDRAAPALSSSPLLLQYLFFLLLCGLSTLSFHVPIRLLCTYTPSILRQWGVIPYYPHPVTISTALIVSSCTKLFPILLIVWEYDLPSAATAVSWAVIVNNVAALEILMDCGYLRAAVLAFVGAGCRAVVEWCLLRLIGLQDTGASDLGTGMILQMLGHGKWWLQRPL